MKLFVYFKRNAAEQIFFFFLGRTVPEIRSGIDDVDMLEKHAGTKSDHCGNKNPGILMLAQGC